MPGRTLLALLLLLAVPAAAQDGGRRGFTDVLEGTERVGGPSAVDPATHREGWIHAGRVVAGRYQVHGPAELEALRVLEHQPNRRVRVQLVLRGTLGGVFQSATSHDPRLVVGGAQGLRSKLLLVDVTLDAAGARDDVRTRLVLKLDLTTNGKVLVRGMPARVTLDLVVGHDPVDVAADIVRWGRWRWLVAGAETSDYERWLDGGLRADAIRTANCYQFVKFCLTAAGVPERERPVPRMINHGREQPTIEEGPVLRAGYRRGSPQVDAASIERGLRDYVRQFAGHYRRAAPDHAPRRGDLVIFYMRDGSGFLQAHHVGMYTGEGKDVVHNAGRGPSILGTAGRLSRRLIHDAIATFEFVGRPTLESR